MPTTTKSTLMMMPESGPYITPSTKAVTTKIFGKKYKLNTEKGRLRITKAKFF